LTLLCSNVVKFVRQKIREIVRYLPDQKNNKISAASKTVAILRRWRPLSGSNEMLPRANEIRFLIMSLRGLRKWLNQQVSKVIWQKGRIADLSPLAAANAFVPS